MKKLLLSAAIVAATLLPATQALAQDYLARCAFNPHTLINLSYGTDGKTGRSSSNVSKVWLNGPYGLQGSFVCNHATTPSGGNYALDNHVTAIAMYRGTSNASVQVNLSGENFTAMSRPGQSITTFKVFLGTIPPAWFLSANSPAVPLDEIVFTIRNEESKN